MGRQSYLSRADDLARQVVTLGRTLGLPYIAAINDISSTEPMRGENGVPYAEAVFEWLDPDLRYWRERDFALRAVFVYAVRSCAEPFYFRAGQFGSWRSGLAICQLNELADVDTFGVGSAIIAPAYLPGGLIGAVVWASPDENLDVEAVFRRHAAELSQLALRFIATYQDARHTAGAALPARLTRREIQCLKWAAIGKTDGEISEIMSIAVPTVRFHLTNAWRKLGVEGRAPAVNRAATLGYLGTTGAAPLPPEER